MPRLIRNVVSCSAYLLCARALQQHHVHADQWSLFEHKSVQDVIAPEERVKLLEDRFFGAFVTVYDGDMDQSNATRFLDDCEGMKFDLTKMGAIQVAPQLMSRIESARLEVYKAQHLKSLFLKGLSPNGSTEIFVINETTPFQPPWGWHPIELAEWYMSKVAALDAMAEAASLTATGGGLDRAYHYVHKFKLAIDLLLSRPGMVNKPDDATSLAMKTMEALITHLTHLEERLCSNGALPGVYFKSAEITTADTGIRPVDILNELGA